MSDLEAFVAALMPDWPELDCGKQAAVRADVVSFVHELTRRAPWHVRLALFTMLRIGGVWARLRHPGHTPAGLTLAERSAVLDGIRHLGTVGSGFVRALRTMTVLATLEHPQVAARVFADVETERWRRDGARHKLPGLERR